MTPMELPKMRNGFQTVVIGSRRVSDEVDLMTNTAAVLADASVPKNNLGQRCSGVLGIPSHPDSTR
jgi:hypothetical protein